LFKAKAMKLKTNSLTKFGFVTMVIAIVLMAGMQACKKEHFSYQEQNRSVLAYEMMKEDTSLSIFIAALEKANLAPTLNTYGPFTIFAPDNNAFRKFFASKGKTGLDGFSADSLRFYLTYHIMQTRLKSSDFIQGPQATPAGAGDFISLDISLGYKSNAIANGVAKVYKTDIEYSNALVHKIDAVLNPPTLSIGQFLEVNKDKYSIMIAGLKRVNLWDTLTNLTDVNGQRIRLTLFAETDDVLKAAGIQSFSSMPLDQLDTLMRYHIVAGAGFSSTYTKKTEAVPRANVIERWDSTILSLNGQQYIYFDLAADKLINSQINFAASDVIMRNGVLHNVDKHMEFNSGIKRTQIFWYLADHPNSAFAYGIPGISSSQGPAIRGSGNWRTFGPESNPGRDFLFFNPDNINDSLVVIVPNIRTGKYRINVSYKAGGRGDYQLKYNEDLIGVPTNMGLAIKGTNTDATYDQNVVLGEYVFRTSGNKRLNFVCTRLGGFALDNIVLTPVY
jgi:uncharacterized surface protein with fasciclin (FAS1) repeats